MTMTNDNYTIDMTGRLPVEVRKPWRQGLPECHAKRVDQLLQLEQDVAGIHKTLAAMRAEFTAPDAATTQEQRWRLDYVVADIDAAIVLLKCAEEKLMYTTPTEEIMPKEDLREFDRQGYFKP
jgi:hypothetical protein